MKDTFQFTLSPKVFAQAVTEKGRESISRLAYQSAGLCVGLAFGAAAGLIMQSWGRETVSGPFVLYAALAVCFGIIASNIIARHAQRQALEGSTHGTRPTTVRVEEGGLRAMTATSDAFYPWHDLRGATLRRHLIRVDIDPIYCLPIPLDAFESKTETEAFIAHVNERAGGAQVARGDSPRPEALAATAVVEHPQPVVSKRAAFGSTVFDALRLVFFLPSKEGRPAASWSAVFLLALVSVLLPSAEDFMALGTDGVFFVYALAYALAHIPLLLAAAIASAYAIARPAEVPRILVAGLLISLVVDLAGTLVDAASGPAVARFLYQLRWVGALWLVVALVVYACRLVDPGVRRLGVVVACALFLWPLHLIQGDRSMWQKPYDDDALTDKTRGRASIAAEDVFYKQPELLAQSLEAIRPGRKGVIDVFFIALGGYGSQDVFRREVDATTQLMTERFGAEGHAIRLINNGATLRDLPIASKTSLRAALKRIGRVMDKDEDVLVLFMTSHGSAKHVFSLDLHPMRFDDMNPQVVREALDEAGIRHRVVIVSACYSGGFVKPLESPDTLVVTAAAADRTSFGCSNEAEWTYFGKAYIDEGLRASHSFTKAFEMAKPLILEREAKVRADVSDPQISVGANIAAKLEALERQLDGKAR